MNNSEIADILKVIQEQGDDIRNASMTYAEIHEGSKSLVTRFLSDLEYLVSENDILRFLIFFMNFYRVAHISWTFFGSKLYMFLREYYHNKKIESTIDCEKGKEKINMSVLNTIQID